MNAPLRHWYGATACGVLVLAVATWAGGLDHPLQGDDAYLLQGYLESRQSGPSLLAAFTQLTWGLFYRPLSGYLYTQLFSLSWPATWPMHALALGVHALAAVGVYRLARSAGAAGPISFVAAAIFVTAPVHAEPLLWIAALHGMLQETVTLWALVLLIEARRPVWRPLRAAVGLALFGASLLLKESAVVFLPLLAAHDVIFWKALAPHAKRPVRIATIYGPALLGTAALLVLRKAAYYGYVPLGLNTFDVGYVAAAAVRVIVGCFSPIPWQRVEEPLLPWIRATQWGEIALLGSIAVVLALAGLRRRRTLLWALMSMAATVSPLLLQAIVPAERHLYLPSAFAAVVLALVLARLFAGSPRSRASAIVMAVAWIGCQMWTAQSRVRVWGLAAAHAQAVVRETLALVPAPTRDAVFLYLNVPDQIDGALVLRFNNLGMFLDAGYENENVDGHMATTPAAIPAAMLEAPGALRFFIRSNGGHLYWPEHMHGGGFAPHDAMLVEHANLVKSWLLLDCRKLGKAAYVLIYDSESMTLRLADNELTQDVAERLYWVSPGS